MSISSPATEVAGLFRKWQERRAVPAKVILAPLAPFPERIKRDLRRASEAVGFNERERTAELRENRHVILCNGTERHFALCSKERLLPRWRCVH